MDPTLIFPKAQRHLSRRDPVLKQIIRVVGPCALCPNPDHFTVLVQSILSQQISTKAAASIRQRLHTTLAPEGITPPRILAAQEADLRAAGLSGAKVRYLRDLADKVHAETVPLKKLARLADEDVIACLLPVKGIGRWTAQMFLIFSLGRPDVLPTDDLGLRAGVRRHYRLTDLPNKTILEELAESWRPYRTIATWYLWRSLSIENAVSNQKEMK